MRYSECIMIAIASWANSFSLSLFVLYPRPKISQEGLRSPLSLSPRSTQDGVPWQCHTQHTRNNPCGSGRAAAQARRATRSTKFLILASKKGKELVDRISLRRDVGVGRRRLVGFRESC